MINERKGHDLAVRALAKVRALNKSFNFEYSIIGTGVDVENLRELAAELGVSDCIQIRGWQEPDEVRSALWSADILIHPSPVDEPYGVAVLEAMAAGLVVIASDLTFAALDRIDDGINGLIFKAADAAALTDKIVWCFKNKEKLDEIGNNAQKRAAEWHVDRGLETIKNVINRC